MDSDYELVIKRCKQLERLLEERFGAQGRGLHEKISSLEGLLPLPLKKKLRYIATVRNRLVHEMAGDRIDNRAGYEQACNDAEAQIEQIRMRAEAERERIRAKADAQRRALPKWWSVARGVLICVIVFVFVFFFLQALLRVVAPLS